MNQKFDDDQRARLDEDEFRRIQRYNHRVNLAGLQNLMIDESQFRNDFRNDNHDKKG